MSVSELCALIVEDVDVRELLRHLNRQHPETATPNLPVLRDGRLLSVQTLTDLFRGTQFPSVLQKSTPSGSATPSPGGTCAAVARSSGCAASSATRLRYGPAYVHLDKGPVPRLRPAVRRFELGGEDDCSNDPAAQRCPHRRNLER